MAEAVGDRAFWADAEAALAHTLSDMGLGDRARTLLDASREAVPEGDRRYDRVVAESDRSVTATTCGRYVDAEQSARLGLELATRYGWEPRMGSVFRSCIVDALFELGRYDEAQPLARPVLAGAGIHHSINWMASTMARVAVAQGRFEEAHRLIDDIAPTWSAWGEDSFSIISRVDLARAEGRFDEVRSVGDQAMESIVTSDVKSAAIALLGLAIGAAANSASLSRRRRRMTDVAEAADAAERWIDALESTVSWARTEGGAGALNEAILATANAELGRIRAAPAPRAWAAAVDHWVALSHPFQTAYARLRYAEALLEDGQDRHAVEEALRSGHAVAASIGATPLREVIESFARVARIDIGVRAPERPASVTDAPRATLTERERDVLRLVAAGHTNREIGDQLYISEKTVSVHVSNAMTKLESLSRYEAAASAEKRGLL